MTVLRLSAFRAYRVRLPFAGLAVAVLLGLPAPAAAQEPTGTPATTVPSPAPADRAVLPPAAPGLLPVPVPELEGLEPVVRAQIERGLAGAAEDLAHPEATPATRAATYGQLGRTFHAYGLKVAARAAYENANRLAPDGFAWLFYLGMLDRDGGDFDSARGRFERALVLHPDDVPTLVELAEIHLEAGRFDDARAHYEQALEIVPGHPALLAGLGELALARGDHREAVERLEEALEAAPKADRLHYPLAMAYRGLGEIDQAREHLELQGKVGVRVANPLIDDLQRLTEGERVELLRGRTAFGAGDYAAAAESFRAAVEAEPESVRARVNLAAALAATGDRAGAIDELRRAIDLEPGNPTAHYNLGLLLEPAGDPLGALHNLRLAAAAAPDDVEIRLALASLLRRGGELSEALDHYRHAAEIEPGREEVRLREAEVLSGLGRHREARERLEDALGVNPVSGRLAHALARLLAAAPDPAVRDGQRAVELALRVVDAQPSTTHGETVALAFAEAGECARAAEWQQRVIDAHAVATEASEGGDDAAADARRRAALERYRNGAPCGPPAAPPTD